MYFIKVKVWYIRVVCLGLMSILVGCASLGTNAEQADRTTPEGMIYAAYRAAEQGDLAAIMGLIDLKNELTPIPEEHYEKFQELMEPKVRPQLEMMKAKLADMKGLQKVNAKSKKTLESGLVEFTFDMIMGNGEVMEDQVAKLKLVDGRYYLWLK